MIEDLNKKIVFSSTFTIFLIVGALIGIASFIYYALGSHADLAWTAFHLNFIFLGWCKSWWCPVCCSNENYRIELGKTPNEDF